MRVLFIGGTGIISTACTKLADEMGMQVYLLNRGQSTRPIPVGVQVIQADIRKPETVSQALGDMTFDAVVDWVVFTPEQLELDLGLFRGRTGQYIFISSASAYQTPPATLPVTELTILDNPIWKYSQNKIACEERLVRAYREEKFPITIVRPSHTYDQTSIPLSGGWTDLDRMLKGKPVIVPGDGTSIWVLTHNSDFAKGFVGLLGNPHAIGEAVQITSDELLNWNQIYELFAGALGVKAEFVHIPSDLINAYDPEWGAGLLGDKSNSMIFDNSKLKRLVPGFAASVPFVRGVEEMVTWYRQHIDHQVVNQNFNQMCDRILTAYRSAWPK